jgi:NDP-sugar pyrophosphorylase family protein
MLPIMGKPMVVRAMDLLYRAGIRRFMVVVGEDEGAVASYLSSHWMPNVAVEFAIQATSLTRTLAEITHRDQQPFIITSYNTFVHGNFLERLLHRYHERGDGLALSGAAMSLSKSENHHYAQVDQQAVTQITSGTTAPKDAFILSNLAVCGEPFINFLSGLTVNTQTFTRNWLDLARLYVERGNTATVTDAAWILQVETDIDLLTINRLLLDEALDAHILSELPGTVQIVPPVRIDPQVSIGQGAVIGPHAYLESGCSIGQGAVVRRAVVLQNAVIPAKETISDMIVSSKMRITSASPT